ncbi:MAG: (2Fe-2S)-binding protein [Saprospiraceae bacterium]|nr:(2Fe-2S)-binding protein [Saprospiraceae bacterium]
MSTITLHINGREYHTDAAPDTPLLWVLRDHLGLLGTKYGCGIAVCGACTVHLNGEATRSCVLPVSAVGTAQVTTIEGLSETGDHPVQRAWEAVDVPQCGYCQAGQLMTAAAFLARNPKPSEREIEEAMSGNLCRCGTYHRIREAVKIASGQ